MTTGNKKRDSIIKFPTAIYAGGSVALSLAIKQNTIYGEKASEFYANIMNYFDAGGIIAKASIRFEASGSN